MLFSPRISLDALAKLCHRAALSVEAGIDARTLWTSEATRARGTAVKPLVAIAQSVERGGTLAEGVAATGRYFPPLFGEMVAVGEETGKLDAVFHQMEDHYTELIRLRRLFHSDIAWPLIQLGAALFIIGMFIWIFGFVNDMSRQQGGTGLDPLGIGIYGTKGLLLYLGFLSFLGIIFWLLYKGIQSGRFWGNFLQKFIFSIPILGDTFEQLIVERLAWTLKITVGSGMEMKKAVSASLRSTNNALFISYIPGVLSGIEQNESLFDSFANGGNFPGDFLNALFIGDQSGRLEQALEATVRESRDKFRLKMAVLTRIAGFAVWAFIASFIILLIFRLAFMYFGQYYSTANSFL